MYRDFLPKPIKRAEIIMFIADYLEKNCFQKNEFKRNNGNTKCGAKKSGS